MKRALLIAALCVVMAGCGRFDRWYAGMTGAASRSCVDGVQYLQFTSGASVAYTPDGKVKTCR